MSSSLVSMLEVQRPVVACTFDIAEALSAESMTSVSGVSGGPYGACVTWTRTYSDEQLVNAIATSSSWRGLLRELGLVATSAGAMRSVRSHADRLGVNYSHFKGQRRWSEDDLRAAIEAARTWSETAELLGLHDVSAESTLKGHAA